MQYFGNLLQDFALLPTRKFHISCLTSFKQFLYNKHKKGGGKMIEHHPEDSYGILNYHTARFKNKDFDSHFHLNNEILFMVEGQVSLTVNGKTELLVQGDFAMILSNEVHQIHSLGKATILVCSFSNDFVPRFANAVKNKTGNTAKFHCDKTTLAFLKEHILFSEYLDKRKQDPYQFTGGLHLLCGAYLQQVTLSDRNSTQYSIMNEIADYINQHYTRDLKLREIAHDLGYDYYYCSHLFSRTFGMRFSEYLNNLRCSKAASLILNTDKPLPLIAAESGFQSVRSFYDVFSKRMGTTPQQYRKQLRK